MSLLVWLPLNGNLDNWGSSPAKFSVVGSGIATTTTGKTTPNSYQRTTANTNGYITSDINFTMNGDMTLACWCKVTAIGSPNTANGIITQHGHNTGGLGITIKDIGTQDFRICANTGLYGDSHTGKTDRSFHKYYGSTNIYNAWHHLCITYNSSSKQLRMYVDGEPETITFADTGAQSIAFTLSGNNTTARPFRLFDWSTDFSANGSYKPPCYLNDVRMYDHCLSAKEVKLLGQGLIAHYKLNAGGSNNLLTNTSNPASTSGLAGVPATCSIEHDDELGLNVFKSLTTATGETYIYSSRTPQILPSTQYTFSCDVWVNDYVNSIETFWLSDTADNQKTGTGYVNVTNKGQTIQARNQWFHLTWTFTTKANDRTGYIRFDNNGSSTSGSAAILKIANLKLELGSKESGYSLAMSESNFSFGDDCSGYGNHLTTYGTPIFSVGGARHGSGIDYNQTGYLYKQDFNMICDKWTINFWSNVPQITTAQHFTLGTFSGWTTNGFGFYTDSGANGYSVLWKANNIAYKGTKSVVLTPNTWTMISFVYTGTECITYINGVQYSKDTYGSGNPMSHPYLYLGNSIYSNASTSEISEDSMSDFRFYVSALSPEEITALYNVGGTVAKQGGLFAYEFEESKRNNAKMHKNGIFAAGGFSERGQLGDMKITTLSDGSSWARVFYHKTNTGTTLFTSIDEVMYTTSANKYSRLKLLPYLKGSDGKYEFMLTYPIDAPGKYNRWKQTNAPQNEFVANGDGSAFATGYQGIHIDWNAYYWGGLTRQSSDASALVDTYLSGSVGHGNWFYAIGAKTKWGNPNGVPGYDGTKGMQEIELWVRVDTLSKNSKFNIMKEQFVSGTLFQEI